MNLRSPHDTLDSTDTLSFPKKILFASQIFPLSPQANNKYETTCNIFQTPTANPRRKGEVIDIDSPLKSPQISSVPSELRLSCPTFQKPAIFKKLGSMVQMTPKGEKNESKSTQRKEAIPMKSQGSQKSLKKGTTISKEVSSICELDLYMTGSGFQRSRKYSKLIMPGDSSKGDNKQEIPAAVEKIEREAFHNRIQTMVSIDNDKANLQQKSPIMSPVSKQKGIGISFTPKIPKKLAEKFPNVPSRGVRYVKAAQINGENLNKYLTIKSPSQRAMKGNAEKTPKKDYTEEKVVLSPTTKVPQGHGHKRVVSMGQGSDISNKPVQSEVQVSSEQDKYRIKNLNLKIELPEHNLDNSQEPLENQNEKQISDFEGILLRQSQILKSRKGSRLFISIASPTSKKDQKKSGQNKDFKAEDERNKIENLFPNFINEKARKLSTFESTKVGLGSTTCNSSKMFRGSLNIEKEEKKPSNDSVLEELLEMIGAKEEEEKEEWSFLEEKNGGFCGKRILYYGGCK